MGLLTAAMSVGTAAMLADLGIRSRRCGLIRAKTGIVYPVFEGETLVGWHINGRTYPPGYEFSVGADGIPIAPPITRGFYGITYFGTPGFARIGRVPILYARTFGVKQGEEHLYEEVEWVDGYYTVRSHPLTFKDVEFRGGLRANFGLRVKAFMQNPMKTWLLEEDALPGIETAIAEPLDRWSRPTDILTYFQGDIAAGKSALGKELCRVVEESAAETSVELSGHRIRVFFESFDSNDPNVNAVIEAKGEEQRQKALLAAEKAKQKVAIVTADTEAMKIGKNAAAEAKRIGRIALAKATEIKLVGATTARAAEALRKAQGDRYPDIQVAQALGGPTGLTNLIIGGNGALPFLNIGGEKAAVTTTTPPSTAPTPVQGENP